MPSREILPRSSIVFLIATLVWVLQAIPITGIFLMFLLAPLWNGPLYLLGFVLLTLEAAIGATARAWLVVPLVCTLAYGTAAWRSRAEADALVAAHAHVNDGKTIAFDPKRQSLVIERSGDGIGNLLVAWDLPAYWTVDPRKPAATPTLHRLAVGEVCEQIRKDPSLSAANVRAWGIHERQSGRSVLLKGVCNVDMPSPITGVPVTVSVGRREYARKDPAKRWTQTITVGDGDRRIDLVVGEISPLPWIPIPMIGCALNSGSPSWSCFAEFMRDRKRPLGAASARAAVTTALGLASAPASTRLDRIAADPLPDFAPVVEKRETTSLAALDAALADPKKRVTVHDLAGLAAHPEVWADRAPAMVAAIGRRLAEAKAERETQRNLAGLLAALPHEALAAHLPDLLAIWEKMPPKTLDVDIVPVAMVKRLPEFGASTLAIVERLAFDRPRPWMAEPIRALCRLAPLSGRDADAIAERLRGRDRREEFDAATLALLRLGRRDLVEPVLRDVVAKEELRREERQNTAAARILAFLPGAAGDRAHRIFTAPSPRQKKFETWLATIDATSPPEVCDAK